MRFVVRSLGPMAAFLFACALVAHAASSTAGAATPTVTLYDNDAPGPRAGFDVAQGLWGYAPDHLVVRKGEVVVFNNPASNTLPHTVTNIERVGSPFENQLAPATKFDSSPTQDALIAAGSSWMLDTSTLDQGHYAYYCRIHSWMVASLSVVNP